MGFFWFVLFFCLAKESIVESFESNADFCICLSYLIVFLHVVLCFCCKAGFRRVYSHVEVLLDGTGAFLAGT